MDISNGSGGIDSSKFIDYFTKQLPLDLAQMATLRDELERRQGAMTAVDDANKAKLQADAILASAKAEAEDLVKQTSLQKQAADKLLTDLNEQQKALDLKQVNFDNQIDFQNADLLKRTKAADKKDAALVEREIAVKQKEIDNLAKEAELAQYQTELDSRIKAFQDKVNSLSV
jgi:hypothetical protein